MVSFPRPAEAVVQEGLAEVLAEVRRIALQSRRFVTDVLSGGYRSTFRGIGVEFEDVREYAEGDDPRHVDWNVTARVGRPFVKRYVEEREHTMVFVLDLSPSMQAGLGCWSPGQAAARFCALLGLLAIDNHDRVGLVAGGQTVLRYVPPRKGALHVMRIVRDSLALPRLPAPGPVPHGAPSGGLTTLLREVSRRLRRRTVVFVISDFLASGHDKELGLCSKRHDVVAVRLMSPELQAPPLAMLHTVDPASGRRHVVDLANKKVRAAWLARAAAWQARSEAAFRAARVQRIDVHIPRDPDIAAIAAPVQRFFQRRQWREALR